MRRKVYRLLKNLKETDNCLSILKVLVSQTELL